ncbi:MAG TPA: delta-60 repeat domain-containing protein, partial [Pyrinomonadaceae bacterium]
MNITAFKFTLSLFGLFFTFIPAFSAPGDLDTTFGGTGIRRVGLGSGTNSARSVARQPDGKIVAVGGASIGEYSQFAVVRYNTDGTLDPTFGTRGIVLTSVGSLTSGAQAVALQPDGKIVVAGYASNGISSSFALARYNPDGSLDTSFSDDGKLITPSLRAGDARVMDVALQPDGKIVAVGFATDFTGDGFAVARFNPDGAFDSGFGSGGVAVTFAGTNTNAKANAVAIQPDGKIIAAGESANHFAVVRYNPNGSLDTGFSGDGIVNTSVGSNSDRAYDVALQTDGKIVVAGTAVTFSPPTSFPSYFAVVRYNPDGELDSTFDGDGIVSHIAAGTTSGGHYSLAIQPDGKIVTAGSASYSATSGSVFAVVRYNPNGSLDSTFDGDGIALTPAGGSSSAAFAVALQPDGKIVAAGSNFAESPDAALVRYKTDGSLDEQFGTGGIVSTDSGDAQSAAHAVAIQPDGKIVAAGYNRTSFALARFNVDGTLDATFGTGGIVKTSNALGVNIIHAIALQPDGKIVVAGRSTQLTMYHGFAVARYNPNGSLDTSFDGDGIVITYVGMFESVAKAVAIQADGKIVVAGRDRLDFALIRYNSDGSFDTTFDGDGIVTTDMGNAGDTINDIALQPDGKIVAAGFMAEYDTNSRDSAVARYNPDGSLDTSFSGDGKVVTPIWTSGNDDANGVVIQPDGKIITAGQAFISNTGWVFGLVRYNSDGSLDNTFDSDGIVRTAFSSPHGAFARDVALQPDGKIVAAGNNNLYELADFALVRYNPNGSLDNTFGSFGKSVFNIVVEDNAH